MFKIKLWMLTGLTICSLATFADTKNTNTTSKDMSPPPALQNKVYDAMVGTWEGDSDMMGKKMHDVMEIKWADDLNHQFIIMKLKSTGVDQPQMTYSGMGIFGANAQGQAKTWWFDSWGATSASTGTGSFSDNKLTLRDSNKMFNEVRTFEINGNQMIMHAKGSMTWQGKKQNYDQTTTYTKK